MMCLTIFGALILLFLSRQTSPFVTRVLLTSSALIFLVGTKLGDFSALDLQCQTMMCVWDGERRVTVSVILAYTVYYQNTLKNATLPKEM